MKTPSRAASGAERDGAPSLGAAPPGPATGSRQRPHSTRAKRRADGPVQADSATAKTGDDRREFIASGISPPPASAPGLKSESGEQPDAARFLSELACHWQSHGKAAFDAALTKDPVRYVALAAKLFAGDGPQVSPPHDLVALLAGLDRDK